MSIKSFSDLKNKASSLESIQKQMESRNKKSNSKDTRFWQPTRDKDGSGSAVIRFLPPSQGEEMFYIEMKSHSFQGPSGGWFIENCPQTIGLECPVCEDNISRYTRAKRPELSESQRNEIKEPARAHKQKTKFVSNVYIVKDPGNPANEGKVFLYSYGIKIFEKIKNAIAPEFEDETPVKIYDLWEGANFKLRISNVAGYPNYDKSSFDGVSALSSDDAELEAIWNQQFKLGEFLNPENFKSYQELKQRFETVMKTSGSVSSLEEQLGKTVFPSTGEPIDDDAEVLSVADTISDIETDSGSDLDDLDSLKSLLS